MLWFGTMNKTVMSDEQSKWELFVYDFNMYLQNIQSFSVRYDKRRITFKANNITHNIDCYSDLIRDQVAGGHIPLLNGVRRCQFEYIDGHVTVAVEMPSGIKKERTFYVPIIEK
ncbi:hypothetical protein LYSBPC_18460 [Lysinibacillus piscis]|uniref:Competence protein ComG n=2 Tax=Lysinibacillus piscis TaxID=2518931 RepID=A0ABQ5NK28_9BACI|nr:hypothetical protein LYSBPC_18460 [Lysinibacillus sp. KH24]